MNALRSGSAFARRSLATPPSAPLSSTRLLSSFTFSSPQRSASTLYSRSPKTSAARRSGSTPTLNLAQLRTMASKSNSKIKVKNPVVELDGDEVWRLAPFYSFLFPRRVRAYHKLSARWSDAALSPGPPYNAGKHGEGNLDDSCVNPPEEMLGDSR